jgi:8-oxo-dGTP diphosphatase
MRAAGSIYFSNRSNLDEIWNSDMNEKAKKKNPEEVRSVELVDWNSWKFTEDAVLCFIEDRENLLLIHKKTGLGKGKINAPGGRIEPGEKMTDAAVRECEEEIGITPSHLRQAAELQFIFTDGYSLRGFVFFARSFTGTLIETREAKPFWCAVANIPYDRMWADDALWLPRVLRGDSVLGRFIFEDDRMLSHEIVPVSFS